MSPPNDLPSIIADPAWLPFQFDWRRSAIAFARIPRQQHAQLTFLSDEYVKPVDPPSFAASMADVEAVASSLDGAPHYIFHSAFCGSTVLARALDAPGAAMALNEPQVVNHLALAALQGELKSDALMLLVRLLGRSFGPGEAVVVKPGNEANVVAQPLLQADERSRAIFLYAPLSRFLSSVARKGMWGRIWARGVFARLRASRSAEFGLSDSEVFQLTDLQVAAVVWLAHHAQAANLLGAFPDRVRTLDSETFLANRAATLNAVGHHFGIALNGESIAQGPAFATHSKEIGRAMDPEAPLEAKASIPTVDEEIEMVSKWVEAVAQNVGVAFDFPATARLS